MGKEKSNAKENSEESCNNNWSYLYMLILLSDFFFWLNFYMALGIIVLFSFLVLSFVEGRFLKTEKYFSSIAMQNVNDQVVLGTSELTRDILIIKIQYLVK